MEAVPINGEGIAREVKTFFAKTSKSISNTIDRLSENTNDFLKAGDSFMLNVVGGESLPDRAEGFGVVIEGSGAGRDNRFVPDADPEGSSVSIEKDLLDAVLSINRSTSPPSPKGVIGEVAKALANGTKKAVGALNEPSENPDNRQGPRPDTLLTGKGFVSYDEDGTRTVSSEVIIGEDTLLIGTSSSKSKNQ